MNLISDFNIGDTWSANLFIDENAVDQNAASTGGTFQGLDYQFSIGASSYSSGDFSGLGPEDSFISIEDTVGQFSAVFKVLTGPNWGGSTSLLFDGYKITSTSIELVGPENSAFDPTLASLATATLTDFSNTARFVIELENDALNRVVNFDGSVTSMQVNNVSAVPLPAGIWLMGSALLLLIGSRRT